LILWIGGVLRLARYLWRRGRTTQRRIHYCALSSLLALSVVMITDNICIYYFAMLPIAVVIGLSLGEDSQDAVTGALISV
jgi:hypothetical protein